MASGSAVASAPFDVLPEEALRVFFLALPVDARARAACVCRSWRTLLLDSSLWQVLDLTPAGGVAAERVTENLVCGAVARAGGQLRILSLSRAPGLNTTELLVRLIESDGAELEQVNFDVRLIVQHLREVFAAAPPRLQVLNAQVIGDCTALLPVLRNDPPFGPLRVSTLYIWQEGLAFVTPDAEIADMLALADAVASHESLRSISVQNANSARGVNALVAAAAQRRVSCLKLVQCTLDAESIPALARLLQRGSLTSLQVTCFGFPHAQEENVRVLSAALRTSRLLTTLKLYLDPRSVTELLDAVAAMPALSELNVNGNRLRNRIDRATVGRALGALLRANPPSLRFLSANGCDLGDEGLAPLLDGLTDNTHLRTLACRIDNRVSDAFELDRLAPALDELAARANLAA